MKTHDLLTGLPSRRSFFLALELEASEAQALGKPLSVMVVDIDGFESLMDSQGPDAGNRALITVGKLMRLAIGPMGVLARLQDDQFGVMLKGQDLAGAHDKAEALRAAIEAHYRGQPWALTTTIGVASGALEGEWTGEDMLALAGRRCRAAKLVGRNQVRAFGHPGLQVKERGRWASLGGEASDDEEGDVDPLSQQFSLF